MKDFLRTTTAIAAMMSTAALAAEAAIPSGNQLAAGPHSVTEIHYLFSANETIGETVRNMRGEDLGSVEDLIVTGDDRVVVAILSVGGFLGIGDKLVAVSFDKLNISADGFCLLYTSPSPRDRQKSRMPSSA